MPNIRTSYESARGCGYRKPGGLYLVCDPSQLVTCGRLPAPLGVCPTCHGGIHATRGFTWVDPRPLLPVCSKALVVDQQIGAVLERRGTVCVGCALSADRLPDKAGLVWVGGKFYPTPADWVNEAYAMGASRRIPAVPKGFKVGETLLFVAHRRVFNDTDCATAGIFYAYRPQRIEYVVKGTETDAELTKLEERGLSLVRVVRAEPLLEGTTK